MVFLEEKFDQITDYLEQQSPRDRMLALVVAGGLLLLFLYLGNLFLDSQFNHLESENREMSQKLAQIVQLEQQYNEAKQKVQEQEKKIAQSKVDLIDFLDKASQANNINVSSMKPIAGDTGGDQRIREKSVALTVPAAELGALAKFLDQVENSGKVIKIRKIEINYNYNNFSRPNFNATVASYEVKTN